MIGDEVTVRFNPEEAIDLRRIAQGRGIGYTEAIKVAVRILAYTDQMNLSTAPTYTRTSSSTALRVE